MTAFVKDQRVRLIYEWVDEQPVIGEEGTVVEPEDPTGQVVVAWDCPEVGTVPVSPIELMPVREGDE